MTGKPYRKLFVLAPEVPEAFKSGGGFCSSWEIVHFQEATLAFEALQASWPDIAFVMLPESGPQPFSLYRTIQGMFSVYQIPVICFGDAPCGEMLPIVQDLGALAYIQRPLQEEILRVCLPGWLNTAERLRQAHCKLLEKDDLLMMVAHDLKNPLGRSTFASGILAETPAIQRDAYTWQLLQQVLYANEEISRLVKMLLSLSEMEGAGSMDKSVVEVAALVEGVVNNYHLLAQMKEVVVEFDPPSGMVLARVDPVWLEQAVGNLISNGIKFTPDGGRVIVRILTGDIGLVIQVNDTGIGISQEDLPHIFDKFYRSKQAVQCKVAGNGLGLAIVKAAVNRHGGQILVDSAAGEGSSFSIVLPPRLLCEAPALLSNPV